MTETQKLSHQAEEAEQAVLSAFLQKPAEVGAICAEKRAKPGYFHQPARTFIYGWLMDAWANGAAIDVVILTTNLHKMGKLDECGGASAISALHTFYPTTSLVESHLEILRERWVARELQRLCHEAEKALQTGEDAEKVTAAHIDAVNNLVSAGARGYIPMKDRVSDKLDRMQAQEADADLIRTGIVKLDKQSPMRRGDMPVLAGERKAGKSMLAISIARNVCQNGGAVFMASLEQPDAEQIDRMLHGFCRVPMSHNHTSKMSTWSLERFGKIIDASGWRFDLRDDLFDIASIVAGIRQAKMRWPDLHLAIVDYAQLVKGIRLKGDTREMEVASVSRMLRRCAMEIRCAVLLLCQLNKDGDARESMALEQDMTAMWKLKNASEEEEKSNEEEASHERTISIPRQRNGRSGIGFNVLFQGHLATITNLAEDEKM